MSGKTGEISEYQNVPTQAYDRLCEVLMLTLPFER
jgi:hypothetical protein